MQNLTELYERSAGLNKDQAEQAARVTLEWMKAKFPSALHPEIEKMASGGDFGDATKAKVTAWRDKMEEMARQAGHKAEGFAQEMKERFNEIWHGHKS